MADNLKVLTPNQIQYTWVINNVSDHLNFIDEHNFLTMRSSKFDANNRWGYVELYFNLEIKILLRSIICCLQVDPSTKFTKLMCKLSLVNGNDEVLKEVSSQIDYATYLKKESNDPAKLVFTSNELLSERADLFPSNYLKVICDLTVLRQWKKVQQIFTPISCPSVKTNFKELLESGSGSDVILEVDGKEFKAHKSILLARSPVFAAMFHHDMIENHTNRVTITDILESTFGLLLNFIYTDDIEIELDVEMGLSLLEAACKYQLDRLRSLCETRLLKLMTTDNAKDIRKTAESHNLTDFMNSIDAFIKFHSQSL